MRKAQSLVYGILISTAMAACADTPERTAYIPQPRPYLPVEVSVISDSTGTLPQFPVTSDPNLFRAYLQAATNDRYRIQVSNNSGQRVGVVIAVDGRNIISGQKSYLQNRERMYILNPYSSGEYEGWRTTANQVNRFYFTAPENSYAAAWGDTSAMGVIAVAVYPEVPQPPVMPMPEDKTLNRDSAAAPKAKSSARMESESAGTGYGETHYSPTTLVNFEPHNNPMEKVFLKYEWRETLCKKGIAATCRQPAPPAQQNRFWPDDNSGFAPPPPKRRY